MSSPPTPMELDERPHTTLHSLPSEILVPVIEYLSSTEILILPTSVIMKGLTNESAKRRYPSYTISLDIEGLRRLYKLCSVPYIASQVQDLTILSDRVVKPTRAEFLNFQENSLSHLTCPDMISRSSNEVHVHCEEEPCIACSSLNDSELQKCLARAGDEQVDIERKATDLAILAWALRRMSHLKSVRVTNSLSRYRDMRFTRKHRYWEKRQRHYCCHRLGREPPPKRLPECADWDLELDTKRVNILIANALIMVGLKAKRAEQSWSVGRKSDGNKDDNGMSMETCLRRECCEYAIAKKTAEGREHDTLHAFHVWENCLRRCPR